MIYDDVLLNIFHHCLDTSPRSWPDLAHVCRGWRQIVLTSALGLNLRLFCSYGTPVLKSLDCWPELPIVVQYGGVPNLYPPAPEDDENIVAALMQSGRVTSISLTVTDSFLEKLSTIPISEPFSKLEELVLLSQDKKQLTLPRTFRWGPGLRTLHSTRVAFPLFPQLLLPSKDLVDLQFHEIPIAGYFAPDSFANALSEMANLQSLSLYFLSLPSRQECFRFPLPSEERVMLSALRCLKYRGTSMYLDSFVARIDAPRLEDIDVTLFNQPTIDASQLGLFIERIEAQSSLSQANIQNSTNAISISFTNLNSSTLLRLQISCQQLDWQLFCMAQVCDQFSPFINRVEKLGINTTQSPSGQNGMDGALWLEIVRSFKGARDFRVADELTTDILCALGPADGGAISLPVLRHLVVENPLMMKDSSWDALQSFVTSRLLSGSPVQADVPLFQCRVGFRRQQGLEHHLVDNRAYRTMCSYCSDFECTLGHKGLFLDHLESEHPEVALHDPPISGRRLRRLRYLRNNRELEILVNLHCSLRAPDTVTV